MSKLNLTSRPAIITEDVLRDRLAQEYKNPAEGNSQPLFSFDRPGNKVHILVIWDEWKFLPMKDRCRIALEAYEQAFGESQVLDVSASLGLTSDEAKRLGYDF